MAILSAVRKYSGESAERAAERFAKDVFDIWGIGHQECGNGVLLFLAVEDRQVLLLLVVSHVEAIIFKHLD